VGDSVFCGFSGVSGVSSSRTIRDSEAAVSEETVPPEEADTLNEKNDVSNSAVRILAEIFLMAALINILLIDFLNNTERETLLQINIKLYK
jgi:hypothetical protein